MASKVRIIVTGIPLDGTNLEKYNRETLGVAVALQKEIGKNSFVLQKNDIIDVAENPTNYCGKTLIEPGLMSHRRSTTTKLNKLFSYFLSMRRKLDISVVILVGDYEWLDIRVKRMWDIIERLNYDDYSRLGVDV